MLTWLPHYKLNRRAFDRYLNTASIFFSVELDVLTYVGLGFFGYGMPEAKAHERTIVQIVDERSNMRGNMITSTQQRSAELFYPSKWHG